MAQQIGRGGTITLDARFSDGAGAAIDPVNPKVSILNALGAVVVSLATPTHVSLGHYQYTYAVAADAMLGAWAAKWFALINGAPEEGEDGFTVVAAGTISTSQGGGVTCSPWATSEDAPASLSGYGIDPNDVDDAFQAATDILYELSGRRYPGICTDYVRPQAVWRQVEGLSKWWPAAVTFGFASSWGWCSCHRGRETGCNRVPEIKLPGHPVQRDSIVVKLNGEVFTEWRLDDGRYLVRTDGSGWPCCQQLLEPDTQDRTFSILYRWGRVPDIGGKHASILLGTRLFADWFPEAKCSPPERATRVTRQGVSIDLADPAKMIELGITGIRAVDAWLASKVQGRKNRPATVLVPGRHRSVRRTNQ